MSYIDTVAHDPSAPAGHLPGFAREKRCSERARQRIALNAENEFPHLALLV
jgi:hypothetical protein